MALRTLGTSLLAKASPGSKSRDVAETNIDSPAIPGKGVPGTLSRGLIEEPLQRAVPPGSQKVVGASPIVENAASAESFADPEAIQRSVLPGVGLPSTPLAVAPGASAQALLSGMPSGSAPVGVEGTSVSQPSQSSTAPIMPKSPLPPMANPGIGLRSQAQGDVLGASTASPQLRSVPPESGMRSMPRPSPSPSPVQFQGARSNKPNFIQSILNSLFGGGRSIVEAPNKMLRSFGLA